MKQMRIAIIGYGRSGRDIHKKLLDQLSELFEIVAIADGDIQRREMIFAESGIKANEDYTAFFGRQDIDLVINASFSKDHAPITIDLLQHGFNVLTEKPAAGNTEELRTILEAAETSGKKFFAFQQYRFAPSYLKVKEVIASGILGEIVQVGLNYSGFSRRWDWQTIQSYAAGSLLNTGPHPVDQALDLMGFPENIKVSAAMRRVHTYGDAEDYVKIILQAIGAPVVDLEISSANAYSDHTYLIQGTQGTLKGTTKSLEWTYFIPKEAPEHKLDPLPLKNEKGEPLYCSEKLELHQGTWTAEGVEVDDFNCKGLAFYRHLFDKMTSDEPIAITNAHLLKQIEVISEAHKQNTQYLNPFIDIIAK